MNQDPNPLPSFTPPPQPSSPPPAASSPVPPPPPVSLEGRLDPRRLFDALLRSPRQLVERFGQPGHGALVPCLGILLLALAIYGIVLGCFASGMQIWAAPLKITVGLLISGAICFPSLYIFFCLSGSQIGVGQLATVMTAMLTLGSLLLLGFAPAVWIFTQATNSFGFMGALAVVPWLIALFFGCRFLFQAARSTGAAGVGPVRIWVVMFTVVTLQMSTSLRPILGASDRFLPQEKLFFVQHWAEMIDKELPGAPSVATTTPEP